MNQTQGTDRGIGAMSPKGHDQVTVPEHGDGFYHDDCVWRRFLDRQRENLLQRIAFLFVRWGVVLPRLGVESFGFVDQG